MSKFTVSVNGESHEVDQSAIQVPKGFQILPPDTTPDGFVKQEVMDKTISSRVQSAKQNARQEALSENPNRVSDEDLKTLKAYKEISDDPEKLKEQIEQSEEDSKKLRKLQSEKRNREVAEVMSWNPKVLNDLSTDDVEYEIKTRKNYEGEDEKYAVIKGEDEDTDLSDYAEKNWGHMKPALEATDSSNGKSETKERSSGKKFNKQKSASDGKSTKSGRLQAAIDKNHEKAGIKKDKD